MPLRRAPLATYSLIGACIAVFAGMLAEGAGLFLVEPDHLIAAGGVEASRVWGGEVWRLLSALFVHAAVWHLGLNMWVLWQVGRILERVQGSARYTLVYLVSGVFGFSASLLLHGGISAGASGAIFGVVGGLLALAAVTRETPFGRYLFRALGPFVLATLLIGFLLPFVDNAAHVGGLVAGFLLSYGLFADEKGARLDTLREEGLLDEDEVVSMKPRFAGVALVAIIALFATLVPVSLKPVFSPRYHVLTGLAALRAGEIDEARAHEARAEALAADDPGVIILEGRLREQAGEHQKAIAFYDHALNQHDKDSPETAQLLALRDVGLYDLEHAIEQDGPLAAGLCDAMLAREGSDKNALLLNNCAWTYLKAEQPEAHDPARGLRLAERAVALQKKRGPKTADMAAFLHTMAEGLAQNGDPAEARAVMERIAADELSDDPFFDRERERFDDLARKAAREG